VNPVEPDFAVVEARAPGRYLVLVPGAAPRGILVGFHGYAETARVALDDLRAVPGAERWTLVAPDALHAFYDRKGERVLRSWMTRELRSETIAANVAYARSVLEAVRSRCGWRLPVVVHGFSQGASTAWRAALLAGHEIAAVVAHAGDVPPELAELPPSTPFPRRALLLRGEADEWYTAEQLEADAALLAARGVEVERCRAGGGHERSAVARAAIGLLLDRVAETC
jgi:predicted esterase